ncbi:unnamed protein product [Chrysoparadoxa australica]
MGDAGVAQDSHAYVTVLYDDTHARAVRALGVSLAKTGTKADLVLLVGGDVTERARAILSGDGWKLQDLKTMPSALAPSLQYARLQAWMLMDYSKVILLDANMLVLEAVDDLFGCGGVCGIVGQSELLNNALLVLEPSAEVYKSMMEAAATTFSFSGDDKGFLNSYWPDFAACDFFDPDKRGAIKSTSRAGHTCHRLPNRYTGDLFTMTINANLGMVRTQKVMPDEWWRARNVRIIHFNMWGLHPWQWYAAPFFPYRELWQMTASSDVPGPTLEATPSPLLFLLPVAIAAVMLKTFSSRGALSRLMEWLYCCFIRLHHSLTPLMGWCSGEKAVTPSAAASADIMDAVWAACSITWGGTALLCAVHAGTRAVPPDASLLQSWFIFLLWVAAVLPTLWAPYLRVMYIHGKECCHLDSSDSSDARQPMHPSPLAESCTMLGCWLLLCALIPITAMQSPVANLPLAAGQSCPHSTALLLALLLYDPDLPDNKQPDEPKFR